MLYQYQSLLLNYFQFEYRVFHKKKDFYILDFVSFIERKQGFGLHMIFRGSKLTFWIQIPVWQISRIQPIALQRFWTKIKNNKKYVIMCKYDTSSVKRNIAFLKIFFAFCFMRQRSNNDWSYCHFNMFFFLNQFCPFRRSELV